MNNTDLPPLPSLEANGPQVCEIIRLYLAVWDDLSPTQVRRISTHILSCADCASTQRVMRLSTQLVGHLEASEPSARVDQAVMAAIAARRASAGSIATMANMAPQQLQPLEIPTRRKRKPFVRLGALVAAAAAIMVVALASFSLTGLFGVHSILPGSRPVLQPVAFTVPANVSWDSYVLYHTQTLTDSTGDQYKVTSYHNMSDDSMNVETDMNGKLDVVMVSDGQKTLGLDMMHHVAQWGADNWNVDDSMFDLKQLRSDLKTGKAKYLGKETYQGKEVYQISYPGGEILLLDMQYHPVNVLTSTAGGNGGKPVYDTLQLKLASNVPDSTWNMAVPSGFKMGKLPAKPS